MYNFTYIDYKNNRNILFVVDATSIIVADDLFYNETGINPVSTKTVGVIVKFADGSSEEFGFGKETN